MAETYYIRLPFYLLNKTILNRWVYIVFDDVHISTAEISAANRSNMDYVTFSVTKDPGNYLLKIKSVNDPETDYDLTTICMDDVWVSNDNVNFYSVLLNYGNSVGTINKTPVEDEELYGFNPGFGARLYNDIEFSVEIVLPDAANFNRIYALSDTSTLATTIEFLENNPTEVKDPDIFKKMKVAYAFFQERGY